MLPNARIIDVRREPMALLLVVLPRSTSGAASHYTYSLEDLGRFYRTTWR